MPFAIRYALRHVSLPFFDLLSRLTHQHTSYKSPRSSTCIMPTNISALPAEILLQINSYLSRASLLALHLTCKHFTPYTSPLFKTRVKHNSTSVCSRNLARRCLSEAAELRSGRKRCPLCRQLKEARSYREGDAVCRDHDGMRVALSINVLTSLDDVTRTRFEETRIDMQGDHRWVSINRKACLHCQSLMGWRGPGCKCEHRCRVCRLMDIQCFVRLTKAESTE